MVVRNCKALAKVISFSGLSVPDHMPVNIRRSVDLTLEGCEAEGSGMSLFGTCFAFFGEIMVGCPLLSMGRRAVVVSRFRQLEDRSTIGQRRTLFGAVRLWDLISVVFCSHDAYFASRIHTTLNPSCAGLGLDQRHRMQRCVRKSVLQKSISAL